MYNSITQTEHVPGTERRPLLVHPPDDSCIARDLHALRPSPDSFHWVLLFFLIYNLLIFLRSFFRSFFSRHPFLTMAEKTAAERYAELKKKRTFKKFSYRGVDLDNLIDLPYSELVEMFNSRQRRRCKNRGMGGQYNRLNKKLRASKLAAQSKGPHEKPVPVKTHLRNMIVLPDMIGSVVAVYNGKHFNIVEVKPAMVGRYLGEFSITYKPVSHGRPGIGATTASAFIPLH